MVPHHRTPTGHLARTPREPVGRRMGRALAAWVVAAGALASAALLSAPGPLAAQDTVAIGQLREALEDSAYATPGLRRFVARAAEANARLPELLSSYRVDVESEISIIQAEPEGNEVTLQIEQVASDVLWRRDQPTVQEVVGYRARTAGLAPSVLTMFEVPWVVPTLYGDRIDLVRWNVPSVDEEGRVLRRRAIHPLGTRRNEIYRFTGGDTVLTLGLPDRTLRLVRVEVQPIRAPDEPTLLFEGHMDIDAERHQIVRMRGRMISARPGEAAGDRLLGAVASGATFVEFESSEVDQRFWLPRYQRIEVQAISRLVDARVALRLVSRFDFPELNEPGSLAARYPDPPRGGLLVVEEAVRAEEFAGWETELGALTGEANALDFRDLEPGRPEDPGAPRLRLGVRHLSQLVRYNEPEGVFTGLGVTLNPGRAWEEGRIRAHAGWAWSEETVRGGVEVSHMEEASRWEWLARAERQLRSTGDFGPAYVRESGVPPLVAGEDELFYDHLTAGLVARQPRGAGWAWRFEASRGEDRRIELAEPVSPEDSVAVASVAEGAYWLGRVTLERNPEATGLGVSPGVAVRFDAEGATGDLEWVRLEAGISARHVRDPFSFEARLDGGLTLSDAPPPQRLFELGRYDGLPGYPPRAFAGDRAVLAQGAVSYTLPLLRRPFAVGGFYLPAPAPAPTVILRGGWTDASDDAQPVLTDLGAVTTDGVRSTVDLRLRFFGGGVSVGVARPLDSGGEWRFVWSLAREF